ncbi:MAG TPA: hypothetical protein VGZ25_12275 [Gemmataceae bacterium]|jgi:AraC-like DNA-binding protein|nr:hypothetical protein [Gemmataceae bacterium]
MRRQKRQPIRNKLDLTDRRQVRLMTKRLRLSESELARIVDRIGNSIPTIIKEVALQRARPLTESTQIPASAAVAASAPPEPDILSESAP